MRVILVLLAVLALVRYAGAQTAEDPLDFTITSKVSTSIWIQCGEHGNVSISLQDGSVHLERCTPDEGARAFWDAVQRTFPRPEK